MQLMADLFGLDKAAVGYEPKSLQLFTRKCDRLQDEVLSRCEIITFSHVIQVLENKIMTNRNIHYS